MPNLIPRLFAIASAALVRWLIKARSTDAGLWAVDAYDAFLARRRELIAAQLNSFLGQDASAQEEAA